jgi:predicted membrane channel-forming protein YqfA (hemolysin III family)
MIRSKRAYYGIAFFILLIVEIAIAIYVHDDFIRPYIGDVLVVAVVYFFVRIFVPDGVKLMPLYVFIFAALVEVLQYFQLIRLLGLEENTFARILIGSTFDVKDLFCYFVGFIIILGLELLPISRLR